MKILFYIDCLHSGGKERRLTELLKALSSVADISIELAVMSRDIYYQEVLDLDIKIHYLIRDSKKDIKIVSRLYKLCKEIKPSIVHCWDSMTAIYSVPVCKSLGILLVNGMVINAPRQQNIFNRYWLRAKLTFPFSDIIIGNSEAGIDAYKAPRNKSRVIKNGFNFNRIGNIISEDVIRQELKTNTKYVVGMIASFSDTKDYNTYFEAAQSLLDKRNDITFLAIGNNTDSMKAESLIEKTKQKYFRLLGKRTGVESYINIMDICVLATFTEGISNAVLEYMAMAKPVIATDGGGTNEIIEHCKTGYLVKVSDSSELELRIQELLDDENLRLKMGAAGKQRIIDEFRMDKMQVKYLNLYQEITGERRK
jgi:glycosyltransferase involved in cell wall biosynthesis